MLAAAYCGSFKAEAGLGPLGHPPWDGGGGGGLGEVCKGGVGRSLEMP